MNLDCLDARLLPAINLQFDYSLDTNGFFNDPTRRAALERAGADLASRLDANFSALSPPNGDSWSLLLNSPSSGQRVQIDNPTVAANTVVVYAGGYDLHGSEAGEGSLGGFQAGGDADWLKAVRTRGASGFSLWGGSLAFDTGLTWNFTDGTPARGQVDFYTVATHELGHVLGFGTAQQYFDLVSGTTFTGANTTAANSGTPAHVSPDHAHFAQGTEDNGAETSLQPRIVAGKRYGFTDLDYAVLADIGWSVTGSISSPPTTPATITTEAPSSTAVSNDELAVSKPDGSVQLFRQDASNQLVPVGDPYHPFAGTTAAVRSAVADVTGDGTPDLIFAAGPGAGSQLQVIDGRTGQPLGGTFSAFEPTYTGGLFVTAADVDGDGHADVVVTPDQGGGGRVMVFSYATGSPTVIANFFGIDDPTFRGGARAAAADVNGDGTADLIVGAGFGGGPRVAIFDGRTVAAGNPQRLVNDFYAFGGADVAGLRNGVYIAAGDLTGDGKADVAFGGGPGGGPRVMILNGARLTADPADAVANPLANVFAFDAAQRGGVRLAMRDVDGDGRLDVVAASGEGLPAAVRVYTAAANSFSSGQLGTGFPTEPFGDTPLADGIYVG